MKKMGLFEGLRDALKKASVFFFPIPSLQTEIKEFDPVVCASIISLYFFKSL